MSPPLDQLLSLIAERIDEERCRRADERYQLALTGREVDRCPLVIRPPFAGRMKLPPPFDSFQAVSYSVAFDDPACMMFNQLLDRVVPALLLGDDNPLAIRNDHGTIQVASLLGGHWSIHENNYPWVAPFPSHDAIEQIVAGDGPVSLDGGVLQRGLDTLDYYREKLAMFPECERTIQISMPDLQGPLDTAEQLWGGELFLDMMDQNPLLDRLLHRITQTLLAAAEAYRPHTRERLDPQINTQHAYAIPGRLMIRDDSAILMSADMYANRVRPSDSRILAAMNGGTIHFCGNGEQLIEPMLEIPHLRGIDVGQSEMMDIDRIYARCRQRGVAVTNIQPGWRSLVSGEAHSRFPTGAVLTYVTDDFDDAAVVVSAYHRGARVA